MSIVDDLKKAIESIKNQKPVEYVLVCPHCRAVVPASYVCSNCKEVIP